MTTEDRINILLKEACTVLHSTSAFKRLGFKYHEEISVCITMSEETFERMAYDVHFSDWGMNGYYLPTCKMIMAILAPQLQAAGPVQIIYNSATLNALFAGAGSNSHLGSYPVMEYKSLPLGKVKIKVWDRVKQVWL